MTFPFAGLLFRLGSVAKADQDAAGLDGWAAVAKVRNFGNRALGVLIGQLGIWPGTDPVNN
jgi:hypothetical protein